MASHPAFADCEPHPETPADAVSIVRALLDRPNDETPKLILADWCDDQGSSVYSTFAQLLRLRVRLQNGTVAPADWPKHKMQELRWRRDVWPAWMASLANPIDRLWARQTETFGRVVSFSRRDIYEDRTDDLFAAPFPMSAPPQNIQISRMVAAGEQWEIGATAYDVPVTSIYGTRSGPIMEWFRAARVVNTSLHAARSSRYPVAIIEAVVLDGSSLSDGQL